MECFQIKDSIQRKAIGGWLYAFFTKREKLNVLLSTSRVHSNAKIEWK